MGFLEDVDKWTRNNGYNLRVPDSRGTLPLIKAKEAYNKFV